MFPDVEGKARTSESYMSCTVAQHTAPSAERLSPKHVTYAMSEFFRAFFFHFSPSMAPLKELLSQLTHKGSFAVPFLLLWGKSPETQSM